MPRGPRGTMSLAAPSFHWCIMTGLSGQRDLLGLFRGVSLAPRRYGLKSHVTAGLSGEGGTIAQRSVKWRDLITPEP